MKSNTIRQIVEDTLLREGPEEAAATAEVIKALDAVKAALQKKQQLEAKPPAAPVGASASAPAASVDTDENEYSEKANKEEIKKAMNSKKPIIGGVDIPKKDIEKFKLSLPKNKSSKKQRAIK